MDISKVKVVDILESFNQWKIETVAQIPGEVGTGKDFKGALEKYIQCESMEEDDRLKEEAKRRRHRFPFKLECSPAGLPVSVKKSPFCDSSTFLGMRCGGMAKGAAEIGSFNSNKYGGPCARVGVL